jgi:Thioesterase-like superfamily
MEDAYFKREGDAYLPQPHSRGPWNPNSLHGRVVIGLLGYELERTHGGPEWMPARLTADMYRLPDFSPITAKTTLIRAGRRIKIVDCELIQGGKSVARGTAQFLIRGENAPGKTWSPPHWDAPHPDSLPPPPANQFGGRMWKMRNISDWFSSDGARRGAWMAEIRELVEGSPLTPFTRVAVAADFASPLANRSENSLGYINTDVTVYLHRLPVGEWIGFEKINHHATDGVAIGECFLHDIEGPIGSASCAALRQAREAPFTPPRQQS